MSHGRLWLVETGPVALRRLWTCHGRNNQRLFSANFPTLTARIRMLVCVSKYGRFAEMASVYKEPPRLATTKKMEMITRNSQCKPLCHFDEYSSRLKMSRLSRTFASVFVQSLVRRFSQVVLVLDSEAIHGKLCPGWILAVEFKYISHHEIPGIYSAPVTELALLFQVGVGVIISRSTN